MEHYMVFDMGGTAVKYAVMNEKASILEKGEFSTPKDTLQTLLGIISNLTEMYGKTYNLKGIGLSSPGAVNPNTGFIGGTSAIPYIHDIHMTKLIEEKTGLYATAENDANCAALAEGWIGAAKNVSYYACVVIGSGIGGSIVINQNILRGATLHGGEFGYMIVGNPLSDHPLRTTWSGIASTRALVADVERRKGMEAGSLNGKKVFELADRGDADACACIGEWYKKLAAGIYNVKYIVDPEKILIGGAVSKREEIIDGINRELALLKDEISDLHIEVEACRFDNNANLIGALFHHLKATGRNTELQQA